MSLIKLRALTDSDIPFTLKWNNQDEIKYFYAGHPFPVNLEMETAWYERAMKSNNPTTVFGIELIEQKKLIGLTFLKNINLIHRSAEFAIYIGDNKEKGKGYSKEATKLSIDFGFMQLGLNRIYLGVQNDNIPAIKLYEKIGFRKEGILKQTIFKNGQFIDERMMAILKEEYI